MWTGGGRLAAPGAAGWLGLAASPTFALMALAAAAGSGPPDVVCSPMHTASPLSGMAAMYLLMSVFHLPPWLRLIRAGR